MNADLYAISDATYQWSVRVFSIIKRLLNVNIRFHHAEGQLQQGDIFLFNHFARFETFIPQYLIYRQTGSYCRSVAAKEFFEGDDALAAYLRSVGAVPNNHPQLLPLLAAEILRGRKVIIFPEGGMVKDRRVVDKPGKYSVYSRSARERRKHHRGAAVLALGLALYKFRVLLAEARADHAWLARQTESLGLANIEALLNAARKPTHLVPANITFYPLRINDNILRKGMELFNRGLSRRASEELLIEGNILLKQTDMDIRLSEVLDAAEYWRWWSRKVLHKVIDRFDSLEQIFAAAKQPQGWLEHSLAYAVKNKSERFRDVYMHEMYLDVTVNLNHLASAIIFHLLENNIDAIAAQDFRRMLYLAVKDLQNQPQVHLHHSLLNPLEYAVLLEHEPRELTQFLQTAAASGLMALEENRYRFLEKLRQEHAFDAVRLENVVEVYANEVAPIIAVRESVKRALRDAKRFDAKAYAQLRFDDQLRLYAWDKQNFNDSRYAEINAQQTATRDANAYLHLPKKNPKSVGVVLVHGFLASPAELRDFGERLASLGFPVIGVRLRGHGTSPWDLRERRWEDWLDSVRSGYQILAPYARQICVVGFSTGGALALRFAAEHPENLAGVVAVSVPIRFRNKNMMFVPLLHGANRLVRWVSSYEGIMPFRLNESEHPDINYRHIPIRGLYELRRLIADLEEHLSKIECPALIMQGDEDPVVVPESAHIVHQRIASKPKQLLMIAAKRHGILNENIDNTQEKILAFIHELAGLPYVSTHAHKTETVVITADAGIQQLR